MADTIRARLATLPAPEVAGAPRRRGRRRALLDRRAARARARARAATGRVAQRAAGLGTERRRARAADRARCARGQGLHRAHRRRRARRASTSTRLRTPARARWCTRTCPRTSAQQRTCPGRALARADVGLAVESMAALLAPAPRARRRARPRGARLPASRGRRARAHAHDDGAGVRGKGAAVDRSGRRAQAHRRVARTRLAAGHARPPRGRRARAFEEIVRLAWVFGARGRGGAALNRIARIERERGEPRSGARPPTRRRCSLFSSIGDQRGVASSHDDMAQIHRMRGELEPR